MNVSVLLVVLCVLLLALLTLAVLCWPRLPMLVKVLGVVAGLLCISALIQGSFTLLWVSGLFVVAAVLIGQIGPNEKARRQWAQLTRSPRVVR